MLRPVAGSRPKHKTFDYQPRFYDPEEEERKRRRSIRFQRHHPRRGRNLVWVYALLLFLVFWILIRW